MNTQLNKLKKTELLNIISKMSKKDLINIINIKYGGNDGTSKINIEYNPSINNKKNINPMSNNDTYERIYENNTTKNNKNNKNNKNK